MTLALHQAVLRGDVATVRTLLIDKGADPNERDYEKRTPLHLAAMMRSLPMTQLLVDHGANVDARSLLGLQPRDVAKGASSSSGPCSAALMTLLGSSSTSSTPLRSPNVATIRRRQVSNVDVSTSPTNSPDTETGSSSSSAAADATTPPEDNVVEANRIESTEVVNPRVMRKVIIVVLLPFLMLIFVNGVLFGLKFLLLTALFYFLLVGYFISEITIRPPWYHHHPQQTTFTAKGCPEYWEGHTHDPMTDFGISFEDVVIESTDGYRLSGWYVPPSSHVPSRNVAVVCAHGGGRDRRAWLRHLPMFYNAGVTVLLFDFREHGLSSGNCGGFTYGMKERFDVVAAATYMKAVRKHCRVVVMGTSVGASSVIMAAAMDKANIDGVIAENAITTCALLQDYVITNLLGGYFSRHWVSVYVFNIFRRTCSAWLNFRVGNKPSKHCQALHCVNKISPRPLLLMHGTNDEVVPLDHSHSLFEVAREPKELWLCEGAFHCGLYNKDATEFERRVFQLLDAVAAP